MKKPFFVFVINAAQTELLASAHALFRKEHGDRIRIHFFATHDIEEETVSATTVIENLRRADMVFLDVRGGGKTSGLCHAALAATNQPVALLLGGSPELMSLVRLGSFTLQSIMKRGHTQPGRAPSATNISFFQRLMAMIEKGGRVLPIGKLKHAGNWARMMRYWYQGGVENIKNLLAFAAKEYADLNFSHIPAPIEFPEYGIYDTVNDRLVDSLEEDKQRLSLHPETPTIGLLFYGGMHFDQSLIPAKALASRLISDGLNVLPVYATAANNLKAIQKYFAANGTPIVDAIVYFQWFQLTSFSDASSDAAVQLLKQMGVPVFSACPMYGREVEKWRNSDQGLSPIEALTTVILPELDGMIEPIPTAGLVIHDDASGEGRRQRVVPIEDRLERMNRRIQKWVALRRKSNAEKRVAFVIYDNPPGEAHLGSAAYLDTFASLKRLLAEMADRGYQLKDLPENEDYLDVFLSRRLINCPQWSELKQTLREGQSIDTNDYKDLLTRMVAGNEVVQQWGAPPGQIMTEENRLIFPVAVFGNVLIGLQPVRGFHSDPDTITHDKTLPPHHQYVAFYRWLEDVWQADCIVHVGTHGTLEFLKGKEMGVSSRCFPEALVGNIPHLYFYHILNASEATIAKRRSLGVLVNYNSPSFTVSGLYDDYKVLADWIEECLEARVIEPNRAVRLEREILQKAAALHLTSTHLEAVQEEISRMQRSLIPKGLHVLGEDVSENDRLEFAVNYLRYDRDIPSLYRILFEKQGIDYEDALCPSRCGKPSKGSQAGRLKAMDETVKQLVHRAWYEGILPKTEPERTAISKALQVAGLLGGKLEISNFLDGLDGRYIEPGLGGDPLRSPEVLPSGRNSYQFDPRLVPSEEACRRGREIAENTLSHYRRQHQHHPSSAAVILWGFETTKTRGETVGQILAYLGVRVVQSSNPYYKKIDIIPLAELGRPRIDCFVQICGFFRDMYPNVLELLHRAFRMVSDLDEPPEDNFVRKNTLQQRAVLEGKVAADELNAIASGRIFGPRPGEYGTRTTHLIETASWKSEEEIAALFASSMSHLYTDTLHGKRVPDAYRQRLSQVDLVSQIRDSHEYELVDLDHYYEFFGGLCRTVESVRGQAPTMLITDTTKEVLLTETVGESLKRGVITRLLNPKWIDGLLHHNFHGAQKIADRVQYLIGFAATTHAVETWVWSAILDRYVRDDKLFERMTENNRFATAELLKRLREAEIRGYWQATEEERTLLQDRYLEVEGTIEEKNDP